MILKATQVEYEIADKSGYRFKVTATQVPGAGWTATVTMSSSGGRTAEDAIDHLRWAAQSFLDQLPEVTS